MKGRRGGGFNLIELLLAMAIGLFLIAAFLVVLQRSRHSFTTVESLSRLHASARQALGVLSADVEHAGFFGYSSGRLTALASSLPAGAQACGQDFTIGLTPPVQGSDNRYDDDARDCAPTSSAGGASDGADTLTLRRASLTTQAPRAGRLQIYSAALDSFGPLQLFGDGGAPGAVDAGHEVRDLEVRRYYIANRSVDRPEWPALRVKSLTEARGTAQYRDEEIMPGVEDLQVEFGVAMREDGRRVVRYLSPEAPGLASGHIVSVRLWLRVRADVTETGYRDDRPLSYANVSFTPDDIEATQRRLLVTRTLALRNAGS